MLDKQNYKIVKNLQKLCPDGTYKVFEIQELCDLFKSNKDALDNNLKYLKTNEFIDIKYTDDSVICLCVLPKARQVEEQERLKSYSHVNVMKMMLITGVFSGIMAFIGAFVAMLIIK